MISQNVYINYDDFVKLKYEDNFNIQKNKFEITDYKTENKTIVHYHRKILSENFYDEFHNNIILNKSLPFKIFTYHVNDLNFKRFKKVYFYQEVKIIWPHNDSPFYLKFLLLNNQNLCDSILPS